MNPRQDQPAYKLIRRYLNDADLTAYDLAYMLKINVKNVQKYIKLLHEKGFIFICYWKIVNHRMGAKIPVYRLNRYGDKDEPKPKALTAAENQKNFRIRKKYENVRFENSGRNK